MPAPAQRVQVLLRPKVLDLVKVLSEEENLTLSKVCSHLIEAGLIAKGVLDPKSPPPQLKQVEKEASPSVRSILGVDVPENLHATTVTKRTVPDNDLLSPDDLELLRKLKALKSVGLL